jgi:hypothetical protein
VVFMNNPGYRFKKNVLEGRVRLFLFGEF